MLQTEPDQCAVEERCFVIEFPCEPMTRGMPSYLGCDGVVNNPAEARHFNAAEALGARIAARILSTHGQPRIRRIAWRMHLE